MWNVTYRDPEGFRDTLEVDGEDPADAEEAARCELSSMHPSVDTDEWDILSVEPVTVPLPTR